VTLAEEVRPRVVQRPLYRLYPRQREAMRLLGFTLPGERAPDPVVEEMLYGGEAGGGKSLLVRALAITLMTLWEGSVSAIFRRTYPELEDSHIRPILKETAGTAFSYHEGRRELRAPNGSVCLFRYADDEKDLRHYQSAEWEALFIDEATHMPGDYIEFLRSRVRSTRPGWRPIILYTSNPGGPGHLYFRDQFVSAHPPGRVWRAKEEDGGMVRVFHRARLRDNPALGREYERRLKGIRDEALRKALMDGDWDTFGDQFFREWNQKAHTIPPFRIPATWRERAIGVDFGYGAPWSCHFYVRDEDLWRSQRLTRWFCYRELYGAGTRDEEQARAIRGGILADQTQQGRAVSAQQPFYSLFCDPSIWSKQPNGLSVAEVYQQALADLGVVPRQANNDRLSGWQRVRDYLAPQADGFPGLVFFETCTHALRTIPALPRDRRNPEDADSDAEDHCADELRYVLMGIGAPASSLDTVPTYQHRQGAYVVQSPTSDPGGSTGDPVKDAARASALAYAGGRVNVPALLRSASQNGRFFPQQHDRSERAMWARFAATVRAANLSGQGLRPQLPRTPTHYTRYKEDREFLEHEAVDDGGPGGDPPPGPA
jgi:Terminase large subunit, T4likevirus-type, N-terminal